jgi:hypothetical protein
MFKPGLTTFGGKFFDDDSEDRNELWMKVNAELFLGYQSFAVSLSTGNLIAFSPDMVVRRAG